MALTTLPYPSLDFVPLDILTAEEMNQIVANYTAINNATIGTSQLANSSITTPKLANKAVTSDKVDWTTFATENGRTSTVPVGTSFVTLKTFTVNKDGNYIIWAKGTRSANYTVGALITLQILKNQTAINAVDSPTVANYAGNHDVITQIMASFPASKGDAVSIQISKDRTDFGSNLGCVYMFAQIA